MDLLLKRRRAEMDEMLGMVGLFCVPKKKKLRLDNLRECFDAVEASRLRLVVEMRASL